MPRLPAVKRFLSNSGVRVYRIACSVFPEFSGRVYLLLGTPQATLIDTGSGQGPSTGQILAGLETVRTEFGEAFRPRDIRRILITHAHIDHVGGLAEIVRLTGAAVGAHPLDSRIISAYNERAAALKSSFARFLRQAGVEPERRKMVLGTFGHVKDRVASVPVDFALADGDRFDQVRVIHTPGHSPGHVCLAVGNILVAGDHLLARTVSQQWPESVTPYTGLGHYLESLEKIARIEEIELVLGGHEPPIYNVRERIEEIRTIHARRLDRVLDIAGSAKAPPTIDEIAERMYSRPEGFQAMLAVCDVGARVEYLDQRGRLAIANAEECEGRHEPVYRYRPA
jgi:glyoxylase-like metal-dependent hydrolase (beta-lactamase superfamily II)